MILASKLIHNSQLESNLNQNKIKLNTQLGHGLDNHLDLYMGRELKTSDLFVLI